MNPTADELIRARMHRAFDTVAARAAATAPGLGGPRRHRRSLAPLGAALGLAVATGVAGAVVLGHHPQRSTGGAAKPPVPTPAAPAPSPTPRVTTPQLSGAAVSADLNGGVLAFGGDTAIGGNLLDPQTALTNQTWTWNGRWTRLHPATSPSPRRVATMVADPAHGEIVLFGGDAYVPGGSGPGSQLSDTWTWDGSTWTERHPRHHPNSVDMTMLVAYDVATHQVLMLDSDSNLWTWDGSDWIEHTVPSGPQLSGQGMLAYDPTTRSVVLADVDPLPETPYSGPCCEMHGNLAVVEHTWSWNGTGWTRLHPSAQAGLDSYHPQGAYLSADPSGGMLALMTMGQKMGPEPAVMRHWNGHTWSTIAATDAPTNCDGLVTTSDGHLLCIDLSGNASEGDHPVQEWTGGHWVVRG